MNKKIIMVIAGVILITGLSIIGTIRQRKD